MTYNNVTDSIDNADNQNKNNPFNDVDVNVLMKKLMGNGEIPNDVKDDIMDKYNKFSTTDDSLNSNVDTSSTMDKIYKEYSKTLKPWDELNDLTAKSLFILKSLNSDQIKSLWWEKSIIDKVYNMVGDWWLDIKNSVVISDLKESADIIDQINRFRDLAWKKNLNWTNISKIIYHDSPRWNELKFGKDRYSVVEENWEYKVNSLNKELNNIILTIDNISNLINPLNNTTDEILKDTLVTYLKKILDIKKTYDASWIDNKNFSIYLNNHITYVSSQLSILNTKGTNKLTWFNIDNKIINENISDMIALLKNPDDPANILYNFNK